MEKTISIFIASSILELRLERLEIENFIFRRSAEFRKRYNIELIPVLCESLDDAFSPKGKQEEYNQKIRESDFCFFVFFTKAGEYTQGEFQVALEQFKKSGKPKIYTFFKVVKDGSAEQSLTDFMNELENNLGHYNGRFEHVDTIKLRILELLKAQEADLFDLTVENNACLLDGKKVMSLEFISEYKNNKDLIALKKELREVDEKYTELKAHHNNVIDAVSDREYAETATKRANLINAIEELEKSIFNLSLRLYRDDIHGEITVRQRKAYELFEEGDIEGANNVLDYGDIKSEYEKRKKIRADEQKKETSVYIRETVTKIEMLTQLVRDTDRFNEIEQLYDDIVEEAFEYEVELDVVFDAVCFLNGQNKSQKALNLALRLNDAYNSINNADENALAELYDKIGTIYSQINQPKKAEEFFLKAIDIREKLAKENPDKFNGNLAASYNNAGVFYDDQGNPKKVEEFYIKAIDIYEKLAKENPDKFNGDLATSYNNAGVFYKGQGNPKKAEEFYIKAIDIYEKLAKENPDKFNGDLAMSYNNAGAFYAVRGNPKKAEEFFLKAIDISEKLAKENPDRFNGDLAMSYNNAGAFYYVRGNPEKAEEFYIKAINIREKLAKENPDKFNGVLATSYNNAGVFYDNQDNPEKAEELYLKAIDIYEKLAEKYPDKFNGDLARSYTNAGIFFDDHGNPEKTEDFFLKTIDIREKLAKDNPDKFNGDLAKSYNNAGLFYDDHGNPKKAEEFFLKTIDIREKLAKKHPDKFTGDLAKSYNNAGDFYAVQGNPKEAARFYIKAIKTSKKT